MTRELSYERVKAMRDQTGKGLEECRAILIKEDRQKALSDMQNELLGRRHPTNSQLIRLLDILIEWNAQ